MKMDLISLEKSTFETAQKDLFSIVTKIIGNEKLKKLLFYQTKDALDKRNLTNEESLSLLHKNIRVIPKIEKDEFEETYMIITFDNFLTNETNPEFRDNTITFDIICHLDNWIMENYSLRPYLIMGELDGMLNNKKLNGIGVTEFLSANQLILSPTLAGYTIVYRVVNDV